MSSSYTGNNQGDELMRRKLERQQQQQQHRRPHHATTVAQQFEQPNGALPPPPSNWEDSTTTAGSYFSGRRNRSTGFQAGGGGDLIPSAIDHHDHDHHHMHVRLPTPPTPESRKLGALGEEHVEEKPTSSSSAQQHPKHLPSVPSSNLKSGSTVHPLKFLVQHQSSGSLGGSIGGGGGFGLTIPVGPGGASISGMPPYQAHLVERQRQLDSIAQDRIAEALVEQRIEEERRLDACRRQRDVERMKLRQRVKQRLELQAKACQVEGDSSSNLHHELTQTASHRKSLRDLPTAAYLDFNRDRLTASMRHRQACLEIRRGRTQNRVALEEYVGTDFAMQRRSLQMQAGSTESALAGRCPTPSELIKGRTMSAHEAARIREELQESERAVAEMDEIDRFEKQLEAQRRAERRNYNKRQEGEEGSTAAVVKSAPPMKRVRELPMTLDAPYRQNARKKEPIVA